MTAGKRVLLLAVPLMAFALSGAFYVPPTVSDISQVDESGAEAPLTSLPALPGWAGDELPDFSKYQDTTEKKAAFFSFLYPRIILANSRILIERDYLDSLAGKKPLTKKEKKWLTAQAKRLRVEADFGTKQYFELLHKRLDVIPPSLILAQAANESAWGTSRFATQGNNLFGQWCFSQGCGLVPLNRVDGASHEVAKFQTPYRSVRAYIQNLNRHRTYQPMRDIRLQDRRSDDPLSGAALAEGLLGYSERGQEYVEEIRAMIHYNNLEFYDEDFRSVVRDLTPQRLQQLASANPEASLLPSQGTDTLSSTEG